MKAHSGTSRMSKNKPGEKHSMGRGRRIKATNIYVNKLQLITLIRLIMHCGADLSTDD